MIRAGLVLLLVGCTSWHTASVSPSVLLSTEHPGKVRVIRPDRSKLVVYQPTIEGDSLVGVTYLLVDKDSTVAPGNPKTSVVQAPAVLALDDIQQIQSRGFSLGRTLVLAGGVSLGVLTAVAIAIGEILGSEGQPQLSSAYPDPGGSYRSSRSVALDTRHSAPPSPYRSARPIP